MPIKFKSNCRICQDIKDDPGLQKRLYNAKFYVIGGESTAKIARDRGWNQISLANHFKKHQAITADDLQGHTLQAIHKAEVNRQVRVALSTTSIRSRMISELDSVLDSEEFKKLSVKEKVTLLLKAAKDADDVAAKRTDQTTDFMKMMQGARSGEIIEVEAIDAS